MANMDHYFKKAREFAPLFNSDDYRESGEHISEYGGFRLVDQIIIDKLRNALKYMLVQVGKKMLSGDFNLATISFPIWCMENRSVLEIYGAVGGPIAPYLNAAALSNDPLFRMKMVMTIAIAFLNPCHAWGKPLNPVLGETYQAILPDGARIDVE